MKSLFHGIMILGTIAAFNLGSARGAVILYVDISDPANVLFQATSAFASADDSSTLGGEGIDLLQFFAPGLISFSNGTLTGSLTAAGTTVPYSGYFTDDYSGSVVDLNLFVGSSYDQSQIQAFSTSSPALVGLGVADFSDFLAFLPTSGSSGDIIAGYAYSTTGAVIGQWHVVPEPGTASLLGLSVMLGFLYYRIVRRRTA